MDERDQQRQAIDAETEGTGRLRGGVDAVKEGLERTREGVEDGAWFAREKLLWPTADRVDGLGRRGQIGVFGGGAVALGGVIAALVVATSGGGSAPDAATTAALVVKQTPAPVRTTVAPAPKPKKKAPAKPTGPILHGAAPDFSPAKNVKAGVGSGKAVERRASKSSQVATGDAPAERGAGGAAASTAKIGATPQASASADEQAQTLDRTANAGVGIAEKGRNGDGIVGPVAPKAAKRTARRFAEAFVVYEIGGVDGKVRSEFRHTSTKQLSRALLHRPPRQPAAVKVPRAKVVTVVGGPSKNGVYPVSVSLLRVGATSELRLELERGVGKKWQVTNVLG